MNNFALSHVPLFNTKENNAEDEGTHIAIPVSARMGLIHITAVEPQIFNAFFRVTPPSQSRDRVEKMTQVIQVSFLFGFYCHHCLFPSVDLHHSQTLEVSSKHAIVVNSLENPILLY